MTLSGGGNRRMTADVCHGPEDYRVEQVERPLAGPGEWVIKVTACGSCASDCKCHSGAKIFWRDKPWVQAPVIPGHEFFGVVAEVGEGTLGHADKFALGERVIAEQIVPCWDCRSCARGQYWTCEVHDIDAFQRQVADGGMADSMRRSGRRGDHRAAGLRHPHRQPWRHPARRRVGGLRRRDARPDDAIKMAISTDSIKILLKPDL